MTPATWNENGSILPLPLFYLQPLPPWVCPGKSLSPIQKEKSRKDNLQCLFSLLPPPTGHLLRVTRVCLLTLSQSSDLNSPPCGHMVPAEVASGFRDLPVLSSLDLCSLEAPAPSLAVHVPSHFWFSSGFLGHSLLGYVPSQSDLRAWPGAVLSPCSILSSWVMPSVPGLNMPPP